VGRAPGGEEVAPMRLLEAAILSRTTDVSPGVVARGERTAQTTEDAADPATQQSKGPSELEPLRFGVVPVAPPREPGRRLSTGRPGPAKLCHRQTGEPNWRRQALAVSARGSPRFGEPWLHGTPSPHPPPPPPFHPPHFPP